MFAAAAWVVLSKIHGVGLIAGCLHFEMILCMMLGRLKYVKVDIGAGVVPGKMCGVMSKGMRVEWDSPSDVSMSSTGSASLCDCFGDVVGMWVEAGCDISWGGKDDVVDVESGGGDSSVVSCGMVVVISRRLVSVGGLYGGDGRGIGVGLGVGGSGGGECAVLMDGLRGVIQRERREACGVVMGCV